MASYHHSVKSGKKGTGADHARYISRIGKFSDREDIVFSTYGNMPKWAEDNPISFWRSGDKNERANGSVYREHEIALPGELTREQQLELMQKLIEKLAGKKPYQCAIHAPSASLEGGVLNTHMHLMHSDRIPDGIERGQDQFFRRYNARRPELGGARKDSGGKNPMQLSSALKETRRTSAELQNEILAKYEHRSRVDHRTLKEQGIDRTAETHLGPALIRAMTINERQCYAATRP